MGSPFRFRDVPNFFVLSVSFVVKKVNHKGHKEHKGGTKAKE
jgi:hypothetical protein